MNDNAPILAAILCMLMPDIMAFNPWLGAAVGIGTLIFICFQIITDIAKRKEEHAEHLKRMEAADRAEARVGL